MKKHLITNLFITTLLTLTGCNAKEIRPDNGAQNSRTSAPSCLESYPAIQQALQAEDLETLAKELSHLKNESEKKQNQAGCSQDYITNTLGRKVSELALAKAKSLLQAGQIEAAKQLLRNDDYRQLDTWETFATLGEIARQKKEWADAFRFLNNAWDLLNNPGDTTVPPSPEEKDRILRLAEESQLLAGVLIAVMRDNPTPNEIPVLFKENQHTLAGAGEKSVTELVNYLTKEHPNHITLVGHADYKGKDDYNCRLSRKRVETVKENIIKKTSLNPNQISIIAKGEREPFQPYEGRKSYTDAEIRQLDRRVEFSEKKVSDSNACP